MFRLPNSFELRSLGQNFAPVISFAVDVGFSVENFWAATNRIQFHERGENVIQFAYLIGGEQRINFNQLACYECRSIDCLLAGWLACLLPATKRAPICAQHTRISGHSNLPLDMKMLPWCDLLVCASFTFVLMVLEICGRL